MTRSTSRSPVRLQMEALEGRALMSAVLVNGDLHIAGTPLGDTVSVEYAIVKNVPQYRVTETNSLGTHVKYFPASVVNGGDVYFRARPATTSSPTGPPCAPTPGAGPGTTSCSPGPTSASCTATRVTTTSRAARPAT